MFDDKELEEQADEVASLISRKLNIGGGLASKIFSKSDISKESEGKIVDFFKACLVNDVVKLKALSEGVAADGGYLVPDEFRAELIRDLADKSVMRGLVRVVPMMRDTMKIPKLGSKPQVRWTSENAAKSTTTADFEEKTLTAYKVAAILYTSEELVEDSEVSVVQLVIDLFTEAIAEEEERVITAGTGIGQPTGLTTCSITNVACNGNLDFDNIIDLIYALPSKYRKNAAFLVNNTNIKELRKVKDGNNRYIWQDATAPNMPSTIYGYPVYENNWLPESEIYFGDYKLGYWLGDRRKITVLVSNLAGNAWERDQVGIRVVERIAGNCVLENAIRCLNQIP